MIVRVCDYCIDNMPIRISLSRRLNGDPLEAEICFKCATDIAKFMKEKEERETA